MGITVRPAARWPEKLRDQLAEICGSHGTGIVPLKPVINDNLLNNNYFAGATGKWTTGQRFGPSELSYGTVVRATSTVTIPFRDSIPYDHLLAYCVAGPGLHAWSLLADGATVGSCGGDAPTATATKAISSSLPLRIHKSALLCLTAPCEAYAVEGSAGSTGVSVDNIAVGGCTAECFGDVPERQMAFADLISGDIALTIISLIANEPGASFSTDHFGTALTRLISYEKARSKPPSILVYAPLLDDIAHQEAYYPLLKQIAASQKVAYFDMRERWGTTWVPSFFGPDGRHENGRGHREVYRAVAEALFGHSPAPNAKRKRTVQ